MKILITGNAGFIGYHVHKRLVLDGHDVVGVDNLNNYYDVNLKLARLKQNGFDWENIAYGRMVESTNDGSLFYQIDLADEASVNKLFLNHKFDLVCHLAAQAGVRYSVENPNAYISSNINGFLHILEGVRNFGVRHLIYASSSSVYGNNSRIPFSVSDNCDHPISLYAATKKSNELMAYCYSYLYGLNMIGLRFFTVYGPWGRPDMALFKFTRAILEDRSIPVFGYGKLKRDFTYIDDIVEGIVKSIAYCVENHETEVPFYKIYNIGNGNPVALLDFIKAIEECLNKKAILDMLPLQPGDVTQTWADTTSIQHDIGFRPRTDIRTGVAQFVNWYRNFYHC